MELELVIVFCAAISPMTAYVSTGYLGCYEDKAERFLDVKLDNSGSNSGGECKLRCSTRGYRYAGTENGEECYCDFGKKNYRLSSECNMTCPGYKKEYCGGMMSISIYDTWHCVRKLCKNNATCEDISPQHYLCKCTTGWQGKHCESEITTKPSVITTITKRKQITRSTLGLDEDTRDKSSLLIVYILVPVGFVIVFVTVVVIVVRRKRKGTGAKRQFDDASKNTRSDVHETVTCAPSSNASPFRNTYENGIYDQPESPRSFQISINTITENNKVLYDSVGSDKKDACKNTEDNCYITPVYMTKNETNKPYVESAYYDSCINEPYETLCKNNICEHEYSCLDANKTTFE